MLKKLFVVALVATIPTFVVMPAAKADSTISSNQWYSAAFNCAADCYVAAPNLFGDGVDGEILPGGTADSIDAPSGTGWIIDGAGTLTRLPRSCGEPVRNSWAVGCYIGRR
jgi:hypothetical protein